MSSVADAAPMPERLGEFRVLGLLGEGAYGTVYEAERPAEPGGRAPARVALKVLRAEILPTERARKQFLHEATLLAQIDHPGVVKVLGFGVLPDDRPYLAMERLSGESLAERLRRGPMPLAEALALFGQLSDAVSVLHARGLLHRDVKPENVYLRGGGGEAPRAVLFDFGIAKGEGTPASTMTQEGAVRGTPAYMAPERFFGAPASTASEVYELGVTLYAMLAGRLPWNDAGDPESRLSPRRPSELGVALPPDLESELLRALSTRAENRPASVAELRARVELAAGAAGRPAPAGADAPRATVEALARRTADLGAAGFAEGSPGLHPTAGAGAAAAPSPATAAPTHTQKVSRRRRMGTLAFIVVAAGAAGGVGAIVGRMAWMEPSPAAADAGESRDDETLPEPEPKPLPPLPTPGPRHPARAPKVPDSVWKLHPKDTEFLVALSWTQVLAAPPVVEIIKNREKLRPPPLLARVQIACGFDPMAELEWVSLGAGPGNDGKDVEVAFAGRWTRDDFERCLTNLGKSPFGEPELRREGRLTWFKVGGRGLWIGWADEHTAILSLRDGADRPWVESLLDGKGGGAARGELAAMRKRVDLGGAAWLLARPDAVFPAQLADGVPRPTTLLGWGKIDETITGELRFSYADAAQAKQVAAALAKELAALKKDAIVAFILGDSAVVAEGADVVVRLSINAQGTQAVIEGVATGMAKELEKLE